MKSRRNRTIERIKKRDKERWVKRKLIEIEKEMRDRLRDSMNYRHIGIMDNSWQEGTIAIDFTIDMGGKTDERI